MRLTALSGKRAEDGRDGREVVEVAARGEVGVGRPGADHDAERTSRPRARDRLDRQRGVVERAEAGAGDDDQRRVEQLRDVGDRAAVVVEAHEQPAGALDEHEVAVERLDEVARSPGA